MRLPPGSDADATPSRETSAQSPKWATGRFPFPLLATTILLTTLGFGAAAFEAWQQYRTFEKTVSRDLRRARMLEQVVYYDEALTMTTRVAVLSGDLRLKNRYDTLDEKFQPIYRSLSSGRTATDPLNVANDFLFAREAAAFEALRLGRRELAQSQLTDRSYAQAKATWIREIREELRKLERTLAESLARERRRNFVSSVFLSILTPFLFVSWYALVKRVRAYLREREESISALEVSETRFSLVARATSDVIWDWDLSNGQLTWSESLGTVFGHYDLVSGRAVATWTDNVHPDDHDRVMESIQLATDGTEESWSGQYRFHRADGTWAPVLDRRYIVRNGSQAVRMIGAISDLTELERAAESLRTLARQHEMILNSVTEGICGVDTHGAISFMNTAGARMLMYEPADLLGRNSHATIHHTKPDGTPFPESECPLKTALNEGREGTLTGTMIWRSDGTGFPAEFTSSPLSDGAGHLVGAVVTFKNIEERMAVERMKNEFISTVSHELRTPLTSLKGALGLLAGGLIGPVSDKGRRMLEIAISNTDRLGRLINEILDISRIESGEVAMEKKVTSVQELIARTVEALKPIADNAEIAIETTAEAANIWVDPDRIIQVLTNLIGNAIKFSEPGTSVTVFTSMEPGIVRFEVSDQGRGIPSEKLETIFGRFQQVDSSDAREKGGTGLGLAICKSIVQQHSGKIWAENRAPRGSSFFFTVPIVEAGEPGPIRRRIFVCDDDPWVGEVVEAMITPSGYEAHFFTSGAELIEAIKAAPPHALLLDILIPQMDGWEILRQLHSLPEARLFPIVVLSAFAGSSSAHASELGFPVAAWVQKPFEEETLLQVLDNLLSHPRVLILVEDDPDLATVMIASLQERGLKILHARSGREAIDLCAVTTPDLLVLDLILPEGDGFVVVDWLRKHHRLTDVPLIVYSAREVSSADREHLRLGQTEFFTKSRTSPEAVEKRVLSLLNPRSPSGEETP